MRTCSCSICAVLDPQKIAKKAFIEACDEEKLDKTAKKVELGPGVDMVITETPDKMGFRIKIEGSFQSGDSLEDTIKQIVEFWDKLDIK
jgi:hypothetical protein